MTLRIRDWLILLLIIVQMIQAIMLIVLFGEVHELREDVRAYTALVRKQAPPE